MGAILKASNAHASQDPFVKEKKADVQARLGIGQGIESNVFFSEQHPQSDTFILSEAVLSAILRPTPKSLLFADFLGTHQHFWKFHNADRVFTDLAVDYQFFMNSSIGIGLSNTLSYSDLKLFDTEGNALPRDKFRSLSERVRLYGLVHPLSSMDLEFGGSYRMMDIAETEDRPPYDFPSLDFKEVSGDLSSRYFFNPRLSTRIKYEVSVFSYDELQANNRDTSFNGTADLDNPRLRLRRQEFTINLKYKKQSRLDFEIVGKLRINDDRFQDDLSYRQAEVKGRIVAGRLERVRVFLELSYRNRYYTDRRKSFGSDQTLKEDFVIGLAHINRNLTSWLQGYLKYQWIHKTSNASSSEFNNHIGMLGVRLIL